MTTDQRIDIARDWRKVGWSYREIAALLRVRLSVVRHWVDDTPATAPLTPPQVAVQLGVSPDTVLAWIRSGELQALNVGDPKRKRPRYRVEPEALVAFKRRRAPEPKPEAAKRTRMPKLPVTRFSSALRAMRGRGSSP
jgi:excisionase family DNA binding protein